MVPGLGISDAELGLPGLPVLTFELDDAVVKNPDAPDSKDDFSNDNSADDDSADSSEDQSTNDDSGNGSISVY